MMYLPTRAVVTFNSLCIGDRYITMICVTTLRNLFIDVETIVVIRNTGKFPFSSLQQSSSYN